MSATQLHDCDKCLYPEYGPHPHIVASPHTCTRCGKVTEKAVCEDCVLRSDDDWDYGDVPLLFMGGCSREYRD